MWQPDICIYHGWCDDGFGAAWAIWKRWGNDVAYVPGVYGKPLPDVTGKHVLFVDFSASYDTLCEMSFKARSIVVIDHHKTAQADLARLPQFHGTYHDQVSLEEAFFTCKTQNMPEIAAWFDMEKSGAVMAWQFARPQPVPLFLELIEDRDLWRFSRGEATRQFSAALRTYDQEFNLWDKLAEPASTAHLISEGAGILRAHDANLRKFMADAYMDTIAGHLVPVVNIHGMFASDMGNALLKRFPGSPFAATWSRSGDGTVKYSLRSEDSRLDVSAVAESFGGGGHRNAAGFSLSPCPSDRSKYPSIS